MIRYPNFAFDFRNIRQYWASLPDYETALDYLGKIERQFECLRDCRWLKVPGRPEKGYTSLVSALDEIIAKRIAEIDLSDPTFDELVLAENIIKEVMVEGFGYSQFTRRLHWSKIDGKHCYFLDPLLEEAMIYHFLEERKILEFARSTGELPEKVNVVREKEPTGRYWQDRFTLPFASFKNLVDLLGSVKFYHWIRECDESEVQRIWNDQFRDPDKDFCGDHRFGWIGTWSQYRAFFDACVEGKLFRTKKRHGRFFAAHFFFRKKEKTPSGARWGARKDKVSEEDKEAAKELVQRVIRMARPPAP